ncbi:Gamma-aminobutyric acid receptor subunit beta-2 [Holothuria leucospilota]|uniref:Gamma-aminobutyric acid receptor subunit beta-2 n=1 Tax=Holothuria leucospilota TaxID=206669 RepID=A0A9Q1H9X5_HOLLE|nr:Gamma-aminobutyric acid receptor subunit beta-2 [Holothuria leucospilota]
MAEDSKDRLSTDVLSLLRNLESKVTQIEANSRLLPSEVSHKVRGQGEKVFCLVKCVVRSVGEIDTVKQTFEAEVFLRFGWREEKFQGRTLQDIALDEYWDPRIYFPNAVTIDERERKHFIQYHDDSTVPYAYLSLRMKATFKSVMQLQDFPLDHQALKIKVMSNWPENMIEFKQDHREENSIFTNSFTEKHEWTLHNRLIVDPGKNEDTYGYPMHIIKIYAKRKISYYMWNVALVTLLILLSNFTSFAVTASAPEDRLSVSVTLLLTAVAFKSVVSSSLPKIPYLTLMDKYVLWSLILQCFVVLQNAIAVIFARRTEISHFFDYGSIALLVVAVLTLNVYFIGKVLTRKTSTFRDLPQPSPESDNLYWNKRSEDEDYTLNMPDSLRMPTVPGPVGPVEDFADNFPPMPTVPEEEAIDDTKEPLLNTKNELPGATEEDKVSGQ